ncbi:MAG: hypothetical protein VSS75_030595 [Candidatus Parabeggiatoa sp.]|nr:hypothetical protein [Candidatus Parabeggiatoa sp.]
MSRLYDKNLTEYSVAAHKISNELIFNDLLKAYELSASLSHLSLNFLTDYFKKINPEAIYGKGHPFIDGLKISLKYKDRAALYMLLCDAISLRHKVTPVDRGNLKETIESILFELFYISLEEMTTKIEERMTKISKKICSKYHDDYSCNLLSTGVSRFQNIGIMAEGLYPFEELKAPGAILGDDYYLNPYRYRDVNYEDRYLNNQSFFERLISFSEACIYSA